MDDASQRRGNDEHDEHDEQMEDADTANGEGDPGGSAPRNDTEDRYGRGESPA
jgi:hypothetical protein